MKSKTCCTLVGTMLLALLVSVPAAFAADSAHVSGYYPAQSNPQDLVFGVHGYVKVTGHIDDGPPGAYGLTLGARAFDNSSGSATCPGAEPAFSGGQLENNTAVGNDFDVQLYSGTITLAHRVLMCFYFHHKDNSVTQSSETIDLRDPIDNISVTAPASVPTAKAGELARAADDHRQERSPVRRGHPHPAGVRGVRCERRGHEHASGRCAVREW